jgi:GT2 family glycosyltransferase
MSAPPRPVTVSVVSHGQWSLVHPLISQLAQFCGASIERLVLTLNLPETIDLPEDLPFGVDVIRNHRPLGFGANHNQAFWLCTTPWFLVLNPDIRIDADVIASLLGVADKRTGLLAPRIYEPGRSEPEPYRALLTPLELFERRRRSHRPPVRPTWVAGMFMLLRADAYRQIGGFDERFHMYCEDADLCGRLQLASWGLHAVPDIRVLHLAQRASQASLRPLAWHLRSLLRLWMSPAFWRYRSLLQRRAKHDCIEHLSR